MGHDKKSLGSPGTADSKIKMGTNWDKRVLTGFRETCTKRKKPQGKGHIRNEMNTELKTTEVSEHLKTK